MSVPFTLFSWWLYIPVTIAGRQTFAHLDTGAWQCRVTKSLAQELKAIGERDAFGVHGKQTVKIVELEQLTFMDKAFSNLPASVIDHESMFADLPFQVEVVLSSDVILAEPIVFDFRNQTVNKQSAEGLTKLARRTLDTSSGLPFFSLQGDEEFNAVFDLGAGNTVIDKKCLENFSAAEKLFDVPVPDTLGGEQTLEFFNVGTVRFGDHELELEALSTDLSGLSTAVGKQIDFIFGLNSMMQGRWFLDTAGKTIGFTPY